MDCSAKTMTVKGEKSIVKSSEALVTVNARVLCNWAKQITVLDVNAGVASTHNQISARKLS